jgi:hypothetical protein
MADRPTEDRSRRDTRLLVLVVVVSIAVLLVLARLRVPAVDLSVVTPSPAPLAGLAARATFDEMANTMADLLARVSPVVLVVRLEPVPPPPAPGAGGSSAAGRRSPAATAGPATSATPVATATRLMPALRVRNELALVHVPRGMRLVSEAPGPGGTPEVVATDEARELALIHVPAATGLGDGLAGSVAGFNGLSFVAVIEATAAGPTVQPVFIGRADLVTDGRWPQPLLSAGVGPMVRPGDLIFAIDSRLIGMVMPGADGPVIVSPQTLDTIVTEMVPKGEHE